LLLFLVFTTLLTCYQLIGNNVLEAFSAKRAVVWLGLERAGTGSRGSGVAMDEPALSNEFFRTESVSLPVADFDMIAPPDADRLFTVNGMPVSPVIGGSSVLRFPGVT